VPVAFFDPTWASEITNFTLSSPRVFNAGLGDDAVPDPLLAVSRVKAQIGEVLAGEGAVAKLGDFRVKTCTDARYFGFGDPGIGAECFDKIVDFAGRDTVDIDLHHDREQGLVDPPPLQQGREA
jgi:hypothetical protein